MSQTYSMYQSLSRLPLGGLGKWLFTRAVCLKAPYFSSISPLVTDLRPGHCTVLLKKRRAVTNHLGTVHAIASCNLAELAMGMVMEASLPNAMRWIPKGMTVQYLKKANTDLRAIAEVPSLGVSEAREIVVPVRILDTDGVEVVHADIVVYLSPKPSR